MRAALLRNIGDTALEVRDDIELVGVGPGEVKVKIEATGVCHSDLSCMKGIIPQPAPAVLGHEGAGIIAEVGEGVTDVKVGDHVIVAWSPPCGECAYCGPRNQPNLCSNIQMVMGGTPHFTLDGQPGVRHGRRRHVRRGDDHPAPGRREDRRRHPPRDRQPRRLRRDDRRGRRHQHRQGHARLVGDRLRLRRRRHLLHPGRQGRRRVGHPRRRPQRREARGRPSASAPRTPASPTRSTA